MAAECRARRRKRVCAYGWEGVGGARVKPGAQLKLGASSAQNLQKGTKPASVRGKREAGGREGSKERGRKDWREKRKRAAISAAVSVGGARGERGGSRVSQSGSQREVGKQELEEED